MEVYVEDLKGNILMEMSSSDIKFISLGHVLSIKLLDKNNTIKNIEGVVISIKHEIDWDYCQIIHIKIDTQQEYYE